MLDAEILNSMGWCMVGIAISAWFYVYSVISNHMDDDMDVTEINLLMNLNLNEADFLNRLSFLAMGSLILGLMLIWVF